MKFSSVNAGTPETNSSSGIKNEALTSQIQSKIKENLQDELYGGGKSVLSTEISRMIDEKLTKEVIKIERSSTEKVGIISTIIGLGIAYVSVAANQNDVFTTTIALILTTTAFTMFATLIHLYFNDDQFVKKSSTVLQWAGATAAAMLILATIGQNGLSKLIIKIINPREPNQIILFNQLFSINKVDPSPSPLR